MYGRLALFIALHSMATLSCTGGDGPAASESVPAVLERYDGSELILRTSATDGGLEFTGENARISFRLVVSDIEVEQLFTRNDENGGQPPFFLEVTEDGQFYGSSDLVVGQWLPRGEGYYTAGFVWNEGSYNALLVGERSYFDVDTTVSVRFRVAQLLEEAGGSRAEAIDIARQVRTQLAQDPGKNSEPLAASDEWLAEMGVE